MAKFTFRNPWMVLNGLVQLKLIRGLFCRGESLPPPPNSLKSKKGPFFFLHTSRRFGRLLGKDQRKKYQRGLIALIAGLLESPRRWQKHKRWLQSKKFLGLQGALVLEKCTCTVALNSCACFGGDGAALAMNQGSLHVRIISATCSLTRICLVLLLITAIHRPC